MSEFIYDPRPIDPPEYFDQEMSSIVTWIVQRTKVRYQKEEKVFKKDVSQQHGDGGMKDVLQMIAEIHGGDHPDECEIFIDATQLDPRSDVLKPVYFEVNYSDENDVHWILKEDDDVIEEDTSSDELFALAEHMINEGKKFSLEFGTIDPTPNFLYDDFGGEAPVTMRELHEAAFQQKRELRK